MDNLKELAAEKEREWRQVQEMRFPEFVLFI